MVCVSKHAGHGHSVDAWNWSPIAPHGAWLDSFTPEDSVICTHLYLQMKEGD